MTAPHTATTPPSNALLRHSKSSLFEKVTPDMRAQVDHALINHDPPTYKAVYEKFDLNRHGVSMTAFSTYARKLRDEAALVEEARMVSPLTTESTADIVKLVQTHFRLVLREDNLNLREFHRLAEAWRGTLKAHLAHDVHAAKKQAAAEAAHSKQVQKVTEMCAKLIEDGCVEVQFNEDDDPFDESTLPTEYIFRTAENKRRVNRGGANSDVGCQPAPSEPTTQVVDPVSRNRDAVIAPTPQSDPACPHAGSPLAMPHHDDITRTAARNVSRNSPSTQPAPHAPDVAPLNQSAISNPNSNKNPHCEIRNPQLKTPYDRAREACRQRVEEYKADLAAGLIKPEPDPYKEAVKECNRLDAAYARRLAIAQQAQATALANGAPPPYVDKRGQPANHHVLELRVARESWLANHDPNDCDATRAANISRNSPSMETAVTAPDPDLPGTGVSAHIESAPGSRFASPAPTREQSERSSPAVAGNPQSPKNPTSDIRNPQLEPSAASSRSLTAAAGGSVASPDEFRPESTNPFVDW